MVLRVKIYIHKEKIDYYLKKIIFIGDN